MHPADTQAQQDSPGRHLLPKGTWRSRIVGHGEAAPAELIPNPRNWRTHPAAQRAALGSVLDDIGWVQQVVVNRRTGRLVDGHLRVAMARDRNEPGIPVTYVDLSDEEEALVLATLDPVAAMATADVAVLESLLTEVATTSDSVRDLLEAVARDAGVALDEPAEGLSDPDEAPAVPAEPVTERGDVWLLSRHRVLCGDATSRDDVARLMDGTPAGCMWTDPPYGVDYEGRTADALTLHNDDSATLPDLLKASFGVADAVLTDGTAIYVAHPAGPNAVVFASEFLAAGWYLHQSLVWVKNSLVLGHSDYHYRHEPLLYGWKGTNRRWYAGRDQTSVFEVPRPKRSGEHPTMKPVELIEAHLRNSTRPHDAVFDPFLGSGSTLIAAERLGRRCAAVELDPRYVDVAVKRWEAHTGQQATLVATGRTFAETKGARRGR